MHEDLFYIHSKLDTFINKIKEKSIFLTGGTGFIGKWLLEYFFWLNQDQKITFKVIVLSRNPGQFLETFPKFKCSFLQFVQGDIISFDFDDLPKSDIIIHAATDADAKYNFEQPIKMIDTIVMGTHKVLDYAVKWKVEKILYLSSGAIYGIQPDNLNGFSENYFGAPDILSPTSAYSEAKRLAEQYCICYGKQFNKNISIARCFAFVGPYLPLNMHFAIGNFIGNGLRGEDIVIKGNGLPLRSYMYAADLVVWLMYILFLGEDSQAYNVGSDYAVSIKDLAYIVGKFFPHVSIRILNEESPLDRNQNYLPDVTKAKELFGLHSIINLETAIKKTIDFNEKNFI